MISLDLTKSSEVRIAGDRPKCASVLFGFCSKKDQALTHKMCLIFLQQI